MNPSNCLKHSRNLCHIKLYKLMIVSHFLKHSGQYLSGASSHNSISSSWCIVYQNQYSKFPTIREKGICSISLHPISTPSLGIFIDLLCRCISNTIHKIASLRSLHVCAIRNVLFPYQPPLSQSKIYIDFSTYGPFIMTPLRNTLPRLSLGYM